MSRTQFVEDRIYLATCIFALGTGIVAIRYLQQKKVHDTALKALDPAVKESWDYAHVYQRQAEFVRGNWLKMRPMCAGEFLHTWVDSLSAWYRNCAENAGYSLEQFKEHVISGDIPWAGLRPYPQTPEIFGPMLFVTGFAAIAASFLIPSP